MLLGARSAKFEDRLHPQSTLIEEQLQFRIFIALWPNHITETNTEPLPVNENIKYSPNGDQLRLAQWHLQIN